MFEQNELAFPKPTSVVDKVTTTLGSMMTHYGSRKKKFDRDQLAVKALRVLVENDLTIRMTDEHFAQGYDHIFEMIAGELHDKRAKPRDKFRNSEEFAAAYRRGFAALNERLLEDWAGLVLLSVPLTKSSNKIRVITLDRDLIVNDMGETAWDVHCAVDIGRVRGQATNTAKRLHRAVGLDETKAIFNDILKDVLEAPSLVDAPRLEGVDQ